MKLVDEKWENLIRNDPNMSKFQIKPIVEHKSSFGEADIGMMIWAFGIDFKRVCVCVRERERETLCWRLHITRYTWYILSHFSIIR